MRGCKKALAWLLLTCVLLTLASCGKEPAQTAAGSRLFAGEMVLDGVSGRVWCTVTDNGYVCEVVVPENDPELRTCTRNEDGTYVLQDFLKDRSLSFAEYVEADGEWVVPEPKHLPVTVRLEKNQTGYWVVTECADPDKLIDMLPYAFDLRDDGTYAAYMRISSRITYRENAGRKMLSMDVYGIPGVELWLEGGVLVGYGKAEGTYSVRNRGDVKKLTMTFQNPSLLEDMLGFSCDEALNAMVQGEILTVTLGEKDLTMQRMDDVYYFCQTDDGECLLGLRENGVCELLFEMQTVNAAGADFIHEPGRSLQLKVNELSIDGGYVIEGNTLKLVVNTDGKPEELVLTEVK